MDHPLTFYYALRLCEGGLHDKLVERRPQQVCCLLQGVLHVLRHPGRDTASIESGSSHGVDLRFVSSRVSSGRVWSYKVDWQVVSVGQIVSAFSDEFGDWLRLSIRCQFAMF